MQEPDGPRAPRSGAATDLRRRALIAVGVGVGVAIVGAGVLHLAGVLPHG